MPDLLIASGIFCCLMGMLLLIFIVARAAARQDLVPPPEVKSSNEHDLNNPECWCEPALLQICPDWVEIGGDHSESGCWRCRGVGLIKPYDLQRPVVIAHRRNVLKRG